PEAVAVLVVTAVESLVTALEGALDGGPDVPLSGVAVLDDAGRRRVLVEWNDTSVGVPAGSVVGLFEEWV
ncbi:hypothetical protein KUG12_10925, partial [Streptomyces sp. BV333]